MKVVHLKCKYFSYEPLIRVRGAEELVDNSEHSFQNIEVFFVAFETNDTEEDLDKFIKVISHTPITLACLYPWIHITAEPADVDTAKRLLYTLESKLNEHVGLLERAPFGWIKKINLETAGADAEKFYDTKHIKFTPTTSSIFASKLKLVDNNLEQIEATGLISEFLSKEEGRGHLWQGVVGEKEPSKWYLKTSGITDVGNLVYTPLSADYMSKLTHYFSRLFASVPYYNMLKTPVMWNLKDARIKKYLEKFPARQYEVTANDNKYFLRFAMCAGCFCYMNQKYTDNKELPVGYYEIGECFRLEQRGETTGLQRLRNFTMPDLHIFVQNLKEKLFTVISDAYKVIRRSLQDLGIYNNCVFVLRCSEQFYNDYKVLIEHIIKESGKEQIVLELWPAQYFYFIVKTEFVYLSDRLCLQLGTLQIDTYNAKIYDIVINNLESEEYLPGNSLPILHVSPAGSIQRILCCLVDNGFPLFLRRIVVLKLTEFNEEFLNLCNKYKFKVVDTSLKYISNNLHKYGGHDYAVLIYGEEEKTTGIVNLTYKSNSLFKGTIRDLNTHISNEYFN